MVICAQGNGGDMCSREWWYVLKGMVVICAQGNGGIMLKGMVVVLGKVMVIKGLVICARNGDMCSREWW
jgi:hypothetical protein